MRITKKIISLLLVVSMLASFFAMTGFEASAALTGQQKTDFGLHFDDTTRKFKVLQLSDIQTDHGDSNIALTTKETIRMAIEQYDPDLILLSGDQVQGGSGLLATLAQWKSSINAVFNTFTPYMKSTCKVIAVPGNHEYDYGNLKDQWEYYNAQSWYLDWDNNFSTVDLNGEPGAGNVTIGASSGDTAVALNIALFNSKGDDEDGYLRPGGDDDAAYQQIVDWYTNMNNTLASSAYSYRAKVTGQSSAYVPAFGMQHVILQEIYNSMVSCGPTDGGVAAATDGNYSSLLNASYMKFRDGLTYTGVLGEAPCPSTLGAGATTALYNALLAPGNFLGMCFGHDHLNTFDITDANGFRFLMGGALTTENYNNGNPNVRYMEFTLDDATGNVDLRSEIKSFNDYTSSAVTDVTSDRIEAIDGNGVQLINTISAPKTIYIGSTENNNDPRAIQKKGNYVQPRLLDYVSKNYYEQDLNVSFCVPANAQISSYGAWAGNGNGTQLTLETVGNETTSEGVRYDFKIATSNTLTDGDTILYKVIYTVDGKPYEIYSSSTVENIKMPAGYTDWFRSWRRSNDSSNYCDLHYVSTLSGSNAYSFGRDTDTNSGGLTSNIHYNYSSPGTDVDLMWVNHHGDSFYSMYFWSPSRVEETSLISRRNIYYSPQTDIYLDTSALQPVAAGDSRLDTGVRIDFWMPMNQGRGFTHYAAGIGFYAGDQDFVWNGTTIDPNDAYATYDDAVNAEENSMSSGTADDATVFVYDSYAGQQKYAGLGTTHVNHNNDDDNKIGNLSGQSNGWPLVVDSEAAALALNNVGMTMFTGVRVRGADSDGARQLNYAIAPFYLMFHAYDKGELRELTMGELMNPRSRTDYPNATDLQWEAYISAYKNAVACYVQTKTTQTNVDNYHQTLNDAIVALLNSNKGKPDESNLLKGTSQFGSIAVPPIIYVSGTTIQTAAPYTDRAITYTVPAGATNVSCVVVNQGNDNVNSAVTTSTTNSGTSYTTTITGGTASAGGAIYYKLSYTLPEDKNGDGKNDTYTQYAASYVKGVPKTEGMWIHQTYRQRAVINYDTSIYIKNTLTMENNILSSRGVSGIMSLYGGVQGTSFHTTVVNGTTNEYTRYGSEGVYWAVGTEHQWPSESGYGAANRVLFFNDRTRAKFNSGDAYWNGLKNYSTDSTINTGGNNSDEYVVANIYFDPQATGAQTVKPRFKLVTTTTSSSCNTPTVYKYWDASNYTAVNYSGDYVSKSPDVATSGMFTLTSTGANNNWANGNSMTLEDGAVWETYIDANNTLSNFTATATYSRLIIHAEKKNTVWNNSIMGFAFVFNRVDRSNAHQAIKWATGQEIVSPSALFNEDDMDPAWWSQWRNEIMEAYIACGNLWGSDFDTSLVISLWQNPIYKEADYSALNDLINDITSAGLVTGTNEHISSYTTIKYKVNDGDDSRYVGQSYDRLMFANNAADLITTIKNRTSIYGDVDKNGQTASDANGNLHNAHLDIRYQGYIDDYVVALQQAWDKLRLQNADYTAFDKFTNYYNSTNDTILFMRDDYAGYNNDKDARDYANEKNLQSAMFTADTRKAFIDSLSIDRTLKKPSETMVVGSLPRIYPAAYTYKNVTSPDTTACLYNTARDAYEGLQFRRAGEYYSADGTYTEGGVTYYANYNKQDRGNGYYYTPVFTASYNSLTANITNGGYAVTDAKVGPTYTAGNAATVPVTDGAGNEVSYLSKWTAASWGGDGENYGFADAYTTNISNSDSTYQTTNSSSTWVLALYVESQICPELANVDYYYDKLKANTVDLTQLNIQKNSYAEYEKGGSGYNALAGFEILDENGNVLTDGAQWYTADTWDEYIAVKQADGTSVPDGSNLDEAQGIINMITQEIYKKRNALQLRPMEDYRVADSVLDAVTSEEDILDMSQYDATQPEKELPVLVPSGTSYPAANDFTSINNIITYYNAVIGNKYVGVFGSRYTVPQDRTVVEGNALLFKKHYYYKDQFRSNIAARYSAIDGYAGKPMATNIQNYVTAVNDFKDLFAQKDQNLNAADYSTVTMLLNKAWIPTYDTYGTGNYNDGSYILGSQYTGADWYTPETWTEYFNARETAAKLYESNNGYDGYLGYTQAYGNGEAVGDLLVDSQGSNATNVEGSINKAAYDLLVAYYKLQHKKVSDFDGTIAGITGGYVSINEQLDAMLLAKEQEEVDVVIVNAAGELETVKKSVYDPVQIELARSFKERIVALENENLGPNYSEYLAAVNNYKTTIENLPQAPVYLDGWNGIINHLNENAGDIHTIYSSDDLTLYFNAVYGEEFKPAIKYAGEDSVSIKDIFSNKNMYDGFGLTAKQGQAQYNSLITAFYNELHAASFVPKQVTSAAAAAREKISQGTKAAYDPLQLNGRLPVTVVTKYDPDSVAAVEAKIAETEAQKKNLWDTDPTVTGYNDGAVTVLDGSLADEIWAAAGLQSDEFVLDNTKGHDYGTNPDERYLLVEGGQFLAALNDALAYAKGELYEEDGVTVKQFNVVKGDGTVIAAPIFTDESVDELLQAIADGESVDSTTSQDLIDDYVFAILEHTDINNTINLLTAEKGYYGQLMDKAEDEGLKYKPADYTYFLEELGLTFEAQSDAAQALVDQVWVDTDGNGEFELVNNLGSTYFTAATWDAYYGAYNDAVKTVRNLTAKDQEEFINVHTTAVYETRNALEWNTIGMTSEWTQILQLGDRIEALRGEVATIYTFTNSTLVPAEESSDGMAYFTAPTWGTKDVNKYGEAETAEIIAMWETFQSEFDENDPYTKYEDLVAIYGDLNTMYTDLVLNGQKELSIDGEFAQGYIDLVNNFIAGSFDGETRQYTSDYLKVEDGTQIMTGVSSLTGEMRDENAVRNAQEKFIEDKLCQIYDLLKGGSINSYHSVYGTSLEAINAYTMELYEYITGTPAQYAGFALDLRQDMIDYLSTTITASVRLRDTAAPTLYTETVHVFDQGFKESKIEEITVGYFDEITNWPTINLLNANVGLLDALSNEEADYNTFVYMVYDEETGEVTGEVMLNSLMENIGAYSPAYNEAIGSVSPHAVQHLNWITTQAVIDGEETGDKTYVLGGPVNADSKAYNVSEEGPTFAYAMDVNNTLDGNWYTKGYGENIYGDIDGDGVDEMYYIAAGDTVTGSDAGGWFTDTSYEKLRTALNNAKVEAADGTTAPIYYEMFGSGDAAQAKYQEIENYQAENGLTGLCWDSATRAEYIAALQTDQKKIDNATASIYEALMGLELLNAVDAYREVAGLIYAALGQVPEYSDANTTDVIITDELVGTLSSFEYGGRLFNISLVDELGEAGVDYVITDEDGNIVSSEDFDDEKTYFYYSTKLPTSYSGGKAAVDAILTMLQSEMSPMLTIDKAKEVNGDEETSVKYKIEYELKNLQLSKADTNKIKSLTAAFLYNNPANSKALGSYDYNGDGANFFKSEHAALASDGTNAGDYRNSEEMMKSSLYNESGFYDFTMYEYTSLMAVITYLKDNNIITDETQATVRNFDQDKAIGFNLVFDYTKHGGDVFNWASTRQDDVNEIYAGLVDVINALKLKDAVTDELDIQAAAADEVVLQENIYDHSAVNPVSGRTFWEEFEAAKAEAEKYENANIVNQEQVDAAAENLELAIRKLVLNEDNYAPVVSVHTTKDELDAFYNSHDELKKALGENSLTPVTYVEKNVGNYALYVYTNQLNPQIVISAQDIKQFTENNAVRTVSTSKPEKINIVSGATLSTISADVIVPHLKDDGTIDGIQELTPNTSAGVDTQTAKNSDGTYVEDSYAYVVLNPKFDATKPATQQAVQYVIDAKDSAQTKDTSGNLLPDNNSADSVAYINGLAEDAVLADGKIKIFVYYMNAMPEDGNDSGVVTGDDNNTAINAAAVLTDHEYKSLASDKWINHAMLYRTFPKALKSWEYSENAEQIAEKDALYTDPTFGENNLGSFVYVLDKNADENSLDYKVAQEYYSTNNAETAKALFINYLTNGIINPATNNAYIAEFESKIESYSGFMTYGAYTDDGQYENWQKPMGSIDNGTLVFVHVADRFGNVCNRLIEWNYYDYKAPAFDAVADGAVSITEDGGSGIANIDLFTYAGTTGGSLYTEYHLSKGLKLQEIAGQITYVSENNEYVVENLKAGALYTVAVKDGAGNVGSAHVKADADGKITISANVDYTNAVQYGKSAAEFATQSGEDLGVIDFVFNSNEIIMLNFEIPSSIVKAGPDGNVFANDATEPLNIIVKSEVEAIKLYNADTGEEEIWTSENAKIKDLGDGTSKWTVKYSFAEGDHNYTATAMVNGEWESASVDFSFTATTKSVKISFLNTGLGRTEYSYNDGIVKKLSSTDVLIAPYGAVVNVKATSTRTGSEFLYWKNDSTDRIISTADTMEFVAVTNVSLTSQFTTTGVYTENKKLVVYVNNAENVVDSFEIAQGGNYTVPDAPALADHVFEEWSMTKDEVLASEDKFIVVKPVYSLVVTNTVTLTEGNWTVTGAGEYQTVGNARAVATISASDVNEDGAGFLYWLDAETGEVASYNRSYTFNVIKDTELTPVYGDASAVVPVPVARITTIKLDSKANSVSFYAERSIPAGYDIIKTGIIVTKSAEKGEDESAFIIDASGVANGSSTKLTANGLYSFSVKADDGTTVYARAYSICMNADGDIITTYSPISSCTV